MSGVSFTFDGLAELREELRRLPAELTGEAGHIIEAATNAATHEIKAGYPVRTGELRDHVEGSVVTSGFAVVGTVRNTSPLAYIFENGTQARHTALGADRGVMPPGHVFIPAIARERRRMYEDLKDLLVRHGLEVSGDA